MNIPLHIQAKIKETMAQEQAFKDVHGKGKPIITTIFQDWRVVAVGNELHFGKSQKTKFFPDFLNNYIGNKLTPEWGKRELAKPFSERHQICKWYELLCRQQMQCKPNVDGAYKIQANGAMLSWMRLAYDLYLVKHNAELQERIINRLRNKQQFQGARFELCVVAAMNLAGYEIKFEDETDSSRRHTEFLATQPSGVEIAVEAKSRHREGVLDFTSNSWRKTDAAAARVAVTELMRKALMKNPEKPYFIFIDVNLPYTEDAPIDNPWFKEMSDTIDSLRNEWLPAPFPANAIFFYNDPTYQEPEKVPAQMHSFWCFEVPIENPRYVLPEKDSAIKIAQALVHRTNIPNHYPA